MFKKSITLAAFIVVMVAAVAIAASDDNKANQTACPIMGGDVNSENFVDYKGQRIFFCCDNCPKAFNKDPEAHLKKMADAGVVTMKLKDQSVCPVSGEELPNKDLFVDVNSKRVYVCCAGCDTKIADDPDKFFKVIADRGEYLEDAKTHEIMDHSKKH